MDVVYVDKDDKIVGSGSKDKAVQEGIIVRIVRVYILNPKGELLIQKRSSNVDSQPNLWCESSSGHVEVGEDYSSAAYRELKDEMGIRATTLVRLNRYYAEDKYRDQVMKRFSTLYVGKYDGPVDIGQHDVSDFRWILPNDLDKEMNEHPENFTEGSIKSFKVLKGYMSNLDLLVGSA